MINVWIKNGEPSLYGNGEVYFIMKTYINLTNSVDDVNEANARTYTIQPKLTSFGPHIDHGVYMLARHVSSYRNVIFIVY
jgi:hypothetical protein